MDMRFALGQHLKKMMNLGVFPVEGLSCITKYFMKHLVVNESIEGSPHTSRLVLFTIYCPAVQT